MTKDEALKMAIEWFEMAEMDINDGAYRMALPIIKACKEALDTEQVREEDAQPAQEPVAMYENGNVNWINTPKDNSPLYTHPASSWQGLEFMELSKIWFEFVMPKDENGKHKERFGYAGVFIQEIEEFARAIEQALKEKNHG